MLNKHIDKIAHESLCNIIAWVVFVGGFVIFTLLNLIVKAPGIVILGSSILLGIIAAFLAGWKKEKGDPIFDKKDILANCVGILRFILQLIVIYFIFKHSI